MTHPPINFAKSAALALALILSCAVIWSSQSFADNDDKEADIRDIILRQIEAFANNDREQAWAYASDGIKQRFGSSKVFVDMVRLAYPAIHAATEIEFIDNVPHGAFEIQTVKLKGPEGKRWNVTYRMVQAEEGWKIAGVRLQPTDVGI